METYKHPYGSIQWKGTNVCMDIRCVCGQNSHVDGEFCYFVKCCYCGTIWEVGKKVILTKIDYEPDSGCLESFD
jgi:hypothetical protein